MTVEMVEFEKSDSEFFVMPEHYESIRIDKRTGKNIWN